MSCSNQIVRFALSDAAATAPLGIDVSTKIEAGAQGLLIRGSTMVGGICADYSGNIYVTDSAQHCIIKIAEGGQVSNFAGIPGSAGGNNANPAVTSAAAATNTGYNQAQFTYPMGICCDKSGAIYVADYGNNQIRKIVGENVYLVAGAVNYTAGFVDGKGAYVNQFSGPKGICVDNSGNLFVTDYVNHALRKITPDGTVVTIAGNGSAGDQENLVPSSDTATWPSRLSVFRYPWGVTVDPEGNVYVMDTGNYKIKKITRNGNVYLHSGSGVAGHFLGNPCPPATTAQAYSCTYGDLLFCAMDKTGNLYVIDRQEGYTRLLTVNYNGVPADVVDFMGSAYVDCPIGVTVSPGQKLFVTMSDYEMGWSSSSTSSGSSASNSSGSSNSSSSSSSSSSSHR